MTRPVAPTWVADLDDRVPAAVTLLRRTGATEFQLRYSDHPQPVLWTAYGKWPNAAVTGSGLTPLDAVMNLCARVVNGGRCNHCGARTVFLRDVDQRPPAPGLCAYQWDPELVTFRRSCEGDHG